MKAFEYAAPRYPGQVLELLSDTWGRTEILAGGTDLVELMKKMVVTPDRVVYIKEVEGLDRIEADSFGVRLGAAATLDVLLESPALDAYPAVKQAIRGINSMQLQAQGTIGGELCQRPRCWFFRNGHGLLADQGRLVERGDNRYHAIFGNQGPAKFVHPSRIAPALIALDAQVRVVGPAAEDELLVPLELFYRAPRHADERETTLLPNQFVAQILLPPAAGRSSASYEVRHGEGPDYPLCAAAAAVRIDGGLVSQAKIVLGQVAPTPWVATEAAEAILGQPITPETAMAAGAAAAARATPLSMNGYKMQLVRTSVQRALLSAAGLETGGF
jgi:xanthine dehydrogenase YagS FAD-binding subunit